MVASQRSADCAGISRSFVGSGRFGGSFVFLHAVAKAMSGNGGIVLTVQSEVPLYGNPTGFQRYCCMSEVPRKIFSTKEALGDC